MRSLALLTIISLLIVAKGGAQNYHRQISYEYLEILTFSLEFSYSNSGTYQPNAVFSLYGNALIALEERYKKNHAIISAEYYKLKDLEMINLYNRDILNTYRNARLQTIYQAGSTWDLSKSADASRLLEFCCEIYSYPSIKRELTLLKNCQNEIDRLKRVNPDGYPLTTR